MIVRTLVAIGLSVCTTAAALAYEDLDGRHLLKACNSALADWKTLDADGHVLVGYCAGLIHGVAGAHRGAQAGSHDDTAPFCLPDSMTIHDGARAVVTYLTQHPERLNDEATDLVTAAFGGAFPCKPKDAQ
jgi:hypothetical protein